MSGVQFQAQADCFFQTLLQPSSENHRLLSKNYSWLLPQQQIFWNSHSIEAENLLSPTVMPVQRQFTFYPTTQYD